MKNNLVITISRQFGSGGREIAKMAAEKLGIAYYDNELITLAAKESGLSADLFENADQTAGNSLLYSLAMGTYSMSHGVAGYIEMPLNDRLFLIQSDIIRRLVKETPCVIVGRCADYLLKDHPNAIHTFIQAPMKNRVERAVSVYQLPRAKCEDALAKVDKRRATYYNYYTSQKWGRIENYDLVIDSGCFGINGSAELLFEAGKRKLDQA